MVDDIRNIRRQVLPNGLTILTEEMPHVRSVSVGIWIKSGSRHEALELNGIGHFVEHMVFKGTKHRSALQIAREVDSIGGNMDAFTAKETICFNIKCIDSNLPAAVDILSDLVLNPLMTEEDIKKERGVILEEIKMDEDNPDYLVHELFTQNFWKGHPLGLPICGTKDTVRKFNQEKLFGYYGERFYPGNLVISAAGRITHEDFADLIRAKFEALPAGSNGFHHNAPQVHSKITLKNKKSLEQVQICMGVESPAIADENRYTGYVLNTLLGGGMSSRLFQRIREEQGLCYAIFSDMNPYLDTGMLAVYAGTSKDTAVKVVKSVGDEFKRLQQEAVGEDELKRAKDQLKGSLMLSLESTMSRMSNLARQEMYFERFATMDETIEKIEKVTSEDLFTLSQRLFSQEKIAVTVVGHLDGLKLSRAHLLN
ncbi:MAG: pitrilysin family protein [Acidobacteriaceae bacterium]